MGARTKSQWDAEIDLENSVQHPSRYRVVMLNDDYTPMDFVVELLMHIFHKTKEEAETLMWLIHRQGKAICGIYTYEVAETKAEQAVGVARRQQYPLRCVLEKED